MNQRQMRVWHLARAISESRPFIVKSKITFTVLYRFDAFVVAQFIAPLTLKGRRGFLTSLVQMVKVIPKSTISVGNPNQEINGMNDV